MCSELDKTQQLVKLDDRHISVVASRCAVKTFILVQILSGFHRAWSGIN